MAKTIQPYGFFFVVCFSLFLGFMVSLRILWAIVRHPIRTLTVKRRDVPPVCLQDESLGSHAYLRTKSLKLHYVAKGDRSKPLMLLLHGFPEFWYSWRHQLREFSKEYRVVAVDMRGYGDSDKPAGIEAYSMEHLLSDVHDAIQALGYSSCVLAAHDWGGLVAWQFAMDHPDLVDKLIIMNVPPLQRYNDLVQTSWKQTMMSGYIFFFQLPYLPEFQYWLSDYARIVQSLCKPPFGVKTKGAMTDEDVEAFKYAASRKGATTATTNYYRALIRYPPQESETQVVASPTLVIWGEEDAALAIELTEGLEKYGQDITVKRVPNASHWVQQDKPEEVHQLMWEFLKG